MKAVQVSFDKTQTLRLEKALSSLSAAPTTATVIVGDTIPVSDSDDSSTLKGHGTLETPSSAVISTVCGVVERVNKLVCVRSLRARYKPEIGDIIVGKVLEIAPKRWRLDINFNQDAVLMLSSMNLPDGIQRRRTAVDELNMRSIFVENDVVCAEVRGFQHDGSLHLQARSEKYGKLERGHLFRVPPYLIKRRKQHFHYLEGYGLDFILGCNGFVWIGEHVDVKANEGNDSVDGDDVAVEKMRSICRFGNAVRVFAALNFMITLEAVMEAVNLSLELGIGVHEMLEAEFHVRVAEKEAERRSKRRK